MEYGHEVWIGAALLDYLRGVKGLTDAEVIRDRMVAEAEEQFEPLVEQYLHEYKIESFECLKAAIPKYEASLQQLKAHYAKLEQELAA